MERRRSEARQGRTKVTDPAQRRSADVPTAAPDAASRAARLLLAAVLVAAVAHRLFLLFSTDFPINDGGLFYTFVEAIARTFPAIPATATYNGLTLPLAYPPLSFWLAALLSRAGADLLTVFHVAPILMNIAFVFLFGLVIRRSGRPLIFMALALLFFCSMQRSFEWFVMGGGISRSLGALFLMATLLAVGIPDGQPRRQLRATRLVITGLCVGGAILSHLEWGLDAAASVVLSRALGSPSVRAFMRDQLISGSTAAAVVLPWFAFVYSAHGLAPFLAAGQSGGWTASTLLSLLAFVAVWSLVNLMIPFGVMADLKRRHFFWLGFLLIVIVTPRHAETLLALPLAIFAASGALWFYDKLTAAGRNRRVALGIMAGFVAVVIGARINDNYLARADLNALRAPQLKAMQWVSSRHRGSSFIVLEPKPWWYSSSAEWFPVLSGARSTNTVQGREWRMGEYRRYYDGDIILKTRLLQMEPCSAVIKAISAFERPRFLWTETREECFREPDFRPVFRNSAVTIYELGPRALLRSQA